MGTEISITTAHRKLEKLNITRKRLSLIPIERNASRVIRERTLYAFFIYRINVEDLVFLDETGFNLHSSRGYGYYIKNQKA